MFPIAATWRGVPDATIRPPASPAPGPTSITQSLAATMMAGLMGSVIGDVLGSVKATATSVAAGAGTAASRSTDGGFGETATGLPAPDPLGYWSDALLRVDNAAGSATAADPGIDVALHAQASRVLMHGLRVGALDPADTRYLGQILARRSGLTQAQAETRVAATFARTKKAFDDLATTARRQADAARKSAAYSALWMFVALLAGAFISALTATIGGRHRHASVSMA